MKSIPFSSPGQFLGERLTAPGSTWERRVFKSYAAAVTWAGPANVWSAASGRGWTKDFSVPQQAIISTQQIQALRNYAASKGRFWKCQLCRDWVSGRDALEPGGALLRQVRNSFGPSWLKRFKLPVE